MSDRDGMLAAIKANWGDDTPRLVYADWLEEYGAGDLDAATVEFIRMSCDRRGQRAMPRTCYPWLEANWQRLVPSVVALHVPMTYTPVPEMKRDGKRITAQIRMAVEDRELPGWPVGVLFNAGPLGVMCKVRFTFCRGLCEAAHVFSPVSRDQVKPALLRDQPLALLIVGD